MTIETVLAFAGSILTNASKAVAGAVALFGVFATLGGPIPATRTYVDGAVKTLTIDSLENRNTVLRLSRFFMGSEEAAIGKTVEGLPDGPNRSILERRRREVQGDLRDIDKEADKSATGSTL